MSERFVIAIDGGGTGTRIGIYDEAGTLVAETVGASTNPNQMTPGVAADRLATILKTLLLDWPNATVRIYAGISGARDEASRTLLAQTICVRVPGAERVVVTTDIHAHLFANAGHQPAMLVIAGTGSSVAVLDAEQNISVLGGRGPILGDDGSAYQVATTALRLSFVYRDEKNESCELLNALVRNAGQHNAEDMVGWCANAEKHEIARLAQTVLELGEKGDPAATWCLVECAKALGNIVKHAVALMQLDPIAPIYLVGGLFEHSSFYRDLFQRSLRTLGIDNDVHVAPLIGHRAVFTLARQLRVPESMPLTEVTPESIAKTETDLLSSHVENSTPLDWLSTNCLVERMQRADMEATFAAESCKTELAQLINRVVKAFRHGGRLIYIGAGTSGRIGVLDASECPPTFGVSPGQVIGIIAGGDRALRESIEGAEDDTDLGRTDIESIEPPIGKNDVVIGIAASGKTPYTLAALKAAKKCKAVTVLVCCNPNTKVIVNHLIVLPTGPEVLPGSTRLKAGTATKMVLNAITTGAMALSGRVFEGYMIHVQPTNEKLKKRAVRIVSELTGLNDTAASKLLEMAGNDAAVAVVAHRANVSVEAARERLARTRGDVRAALGLGDEG